MLEEIQLFLRLNFVYYEEKEIDLISCMLNYINLPYDLKLSLLFCRVFLGRYGGSRDGVVRVLVAAGLVQEKPRELMEDKAHENIDKLISLGMIEELEDHWDHFKVPSPYFELSLGVMKAEDYYYYYFYFNCKFRFYGVSTMIFKIRYSMGPGACLACVMK